MSQPTSNERRGPHGNWVLLLLLAATLAACNTTRPSPTPTWIPSPPGPTALAQNPSSVGDNAASGSPGEPLPQILAVFPLRQGASWSYDVTLDYAQGGQAIHWSGSVTDTVTSERREGNAFIFRVETFGHPLRTDESDNRVRWEIAVEDRLYELQGSSDTRVTELAQGKGNEGEIAVQLPLEVGQMWGAPQYMKRGDEEYVWRVASQEDLTTPAGNFMGCFKLAFITNPDDTAKWLCPKVGIARSEYHHHGTLWNEVWVLRAFTLPP